MKITYFRDTDTLLVEFSNAEISETRDLDENTLAEFDSLGNLVALTMEHASSRADVNSMSFSQTPTVSLNHG